MSDEMPTGPVAADGPRGPAPARAAWVVALAGLALGALIVIALPASWVFVAAPHAATLEEGERVQYACPMFCVVMDRMPDGGRCPVCGMEMTTVSGESSLDADERRMVGLEVGVVERAPLVRSLRLVGEVDYDETRLARITTRVGGWLQTVWIDTTWTEVAEGEPLAAIYSPELYGAEQEFLVASRASEGRSPGDDSMLGGSLLHAARRRLELLGVDAREIADLEQNGTPRDSVVLRAPFGGVVVDRRALEGESVGKGAELYTVADLSRVWVQAEVFETDLPWVRRGQSVRLSADGLTETLTGTVAFVDPVIDRMSRTARLRIEVENPARPNGARRLRIGQRVDARLEVALDAQGEIAEPSAEVSPLPLVVPRSAVLRTGERSILYVLFEERTVDGKPTREYRLDPERLPKRVWYEPLEVRLGPLARRAGGGAREELYAVLGVTAGDAPLRRLTPGITIVTKGNLLLDSQAQLAGKPSLLFPEGNRGGSSDPHAGH